MIFNNNPVYPLFLLIVISALTGCSGEDRDNRDSGNQSDVRKEDLVKANQFLAGKDIELIRAYVNRMNWDIEFTGTGLGYQIYENGTGKKVERGGSVTIEYRISLLDGRVCYSSDSEGPKIFRVGQGGVEAGLEEGIQMLREGDKARFILPPFLAHGLLGDQHRIPPRAVLIYEVEVTGFSGRQ